MSQRKECGESKVVVKKWFIRIGHFEAYKLGAGVSYHPSGQTGDRDFSSKFLKPRGKSPNSLGLSWQPFFSSKLWINGNQLFVTKNVKTPLSFQIGKYSQDFSLVDSLLFGELLEVASLFSMCLQLLNNPSGGLYHSGLFSCKITRTTLTETRKRVYCWKNGNFLGTIATPTPLVSACVSFPSAYEFHLLSYIGSLSRHRELVMDREAWPAAVHGVAMSPRGCNESDMTEGLNWTELLYLKDTSLT